MKKTINLFVDMDGTVAKFYYKKNYLEKMYEQGYFANLPLYAIAKHIDDFAKKETCVNVYILSACVNSPYCEQEKTEWLLRNMPNINPKNYIFTKVGESKVKKIINNIDIDNVNCLNILLDDYTLNLEQWETNDQKNMVGIKFLNGLNDTTKNWQGRKIKTFNQLMEIIQDLALYGNN
jgi:5'(3')-deoxyribonucleotidase